MPLRSYRTLAALALLRAAAWAAADQLTAYPAMSLADGRSTATITSLVLDTSGHPVPDGTRVMFSTTLGSFRDQVVTTINGTARAILVASNTPGTATITATPLAGGGGPATLQYEFVGDRTLLSTAREYIEMVAPQALTYTVDNKVMGAVGIPATTSKPAQQVSLRYREVQIEADQIQFNVNSYEVRASNATLRIGRMTYAHPFSHLFLRLSQRAGFGTTTYEGHASQFISMEGRWFGLAHEREDGSPTFGPPPVRERVGLVAIKGETLAPSSLSTPSDFFDFADLTGHPSHIVAKRAIAFPNRRIQFQRAEIFVAETRVMRVPNYQINLLQSSSPLITEDWIAVQDNQLEVNYPYYLSLRPGQAQILRLHTGDMSSRTGDATSGAFLDYEYDWNRGDDIDGSFALRDIATGQFEADFQQYMKMDPRTTASLSVGLPINSGYYGSSSISHQFNGFDTSLDGSASQTFRGLNVRSTNYSFDTLTTPVKIKGTPLQYSFGVSASESFNSLISESQEAYGPTANIKSNPIKLANHVNMTTSFTASNFYGENVVSGISMLGSATVTDQMSRQLSTTFGYNYTHDGFNDKIVGAHQLSLTSFWATGRVSVNLMAMKSLDIDRETLFGDLDYQVSHLWRFRTSYTYDRYLSNEDLDYTFAVTYHLGWREVGLMWSAVTRRVGIILLGATFN